VNKKLIIINGTMGVGKTTICKSLYKTINNSVRLDGDWCWMMNPFEVNEYNKNMVIKNIGFLLRSFLDNPKYEYVFFNWVIHIEDIYESILSEFKDYKFDLYKITLVCNETELRKRIRKDIKNGERTEDNIKKSIERIEMYNKLNSIKVETSNRTINEITNEIRRITVLTRT